MGKRRSLFRAICAQGGAGPRGHIQFFFSNPVNVASQIRNGSLHALAVTGESRVAAFPDVPTFAEEGMPQITLTNWQGVGGPAGIPKSIKHKISAEIQKMLTRPDTIETLHKLGFEPFYHDPEQTEKILEADIDKYAKIIKAAHITVEPWK